MYIDIDAFKRREFETIIYYFKSETNSNNSKRNDIKFILFLNRMLNETKTRYWFIEFEMIDLMWIIRRIRYIIKTTKIIIVVFTNHVVNTFIIKQIIFINNNTNKFNFRLIRVFIYLSQFRLDVKYRFDKNHVISNVLFRLSFDNESIIILRNNLDDNLNLDFYFIDVLNSSNDLNCYAFQEFLINIFNEFRKQIIDDYVDEKI